MKILYALMLCSMLTGCASFIGGAEYQYEFTLTLKQERFWWRQKDPYHLGLMQLGNLTEH